MGLPPELWWALPGALSSTMASSDIQVVTAYAQHQVALYQAQCDGAAHARAARSRGIRLRVLQAWAGELNQVESVLLERIRRKETSRRGHWSVGDRVALIRRRMDLTPTLGPAAHDDTIRALVREIIDRF
jgi:hypothetical protein